MKRALINDSKVLVRKVQEIDESSSHDDCLINISPLYNSFSESVKTYLSDIVINCSDCQNDGKTKSVNNLINEQDEKELSHLIPLSSLKENVFLSEYLLELNWLHSQFIKVHGDNKLVNDNNMCKEGEVTSTGNEWLTYFQNCILNANETVSNNKNVYTTVLYKTMASGGIVDDTNKSNNVKEDYPIMDSVLLIPSKSLSNKLLPSLARTEKFHLLTPDIVEMYIQKGILPVNTYSLLVACRPLFPQYGEKHYNKENLEINFGNEFKCQLQEINSLIQGKKPIQTIEFNQSVNINSDSGESSIMINNGRNDHNNDMRYSLFVDPMESISMDFVISKFNPSPLSLEGASPISPCILRENTTSISSSLNYVSRNNINLCPLHRNSSSQGETLNSKKPVHSIGWAWDQNEPLNIPALCSCKNEYLSRLWDHEIEIHKAYCSKLQQNAVNDNEVPLTKKYKINWKLVYEGDFSEFSRYKLDVFSSRSNHYESLRYCHTCGGLTYIPYSFIEITLNHEVVTMQDLIKQLPLPLPTDFFSDGFRVTVCIISKHILHEWIILKCLSFIGITSTVRVYKVCSYLIYPFHKNNDLYTHTQPTNTAMCERHNMIHTDPPVNYTESKSYQFASVSNRRPYCLTYTKIQPDSNIILNIDNDKLNHLKKKCFEWLKYQTN